MRSAAKLLVLAVGLAAGQAAAQQGAAPAMPFEEALAKTAAYEVGEDRAPLYALEKHVLAATQNPAESKRIEQALIRALEGKSTLMGKDQICRRLSLIGTAASVPALARLLASAETADMARYALERIPGPEVDAALRNMLPKTSGKVKIGIVNTLGRRGSASSVAALRALIPGSDEQVAMAAAAALGWIGDRTAAQALSSARAATKGALRTEVERAWLRCGEQMVARKENPAAFAVFKELSGSSENLVRIGALRGLAMSGGEQAIPLLVAAIQDPDAAVEAQAIRQLSAVEGPKATGALVQALPKLQPLGKIRVLAALADRGDRAALPAVVSAVSEEAISVRIAALQALEKLGDESVVMLLAQTAARTGGEGGTATDAPATGGLPNERGMRPVLATETSAARTSLYRMRGSAVDQAILANLPKAEPGVKVELILAASERAIPGAADVLIPLASDPNAAVRRTAIQALRAAAGPAHVDRLVQLLSKSAGAERRELARALAAALGRSDKAPLAAVTSAYQSASDLDLKASLLSVMAQTGRPEALGELRTALKDSNADLRRSAVLALAEWPNPEPMPDLIAVARNDSSSAVQILALQSYLRLMALPSSRTPAETVALLAEAMKLARRADEKRAILSQAARINHPDALALVESAMQDPEVGAEARVAADQIRQKLTPARRQ